jgi:DNA-binding CsgD family transcriptional regulator
MTSLLERSAELELVEAALGRAVAGEGSAVLIEGDPGIGKTELLRATAQVASQSGFRVLAARASELEHEYAYGVVRQMLLGDLTAIADSTVLAGAASLAAPVLGLPVPEAGAPAPSDQGAVLHGLYWLTINLASREPLLISLDDAQWSDLASLRFVSYLARRLEGLPVVIALTVRTAEPVDPPEALLALAAEPVTSVLRPSPLSEQAVTRLVGDVLGGPVDTGFTARLLHASGGVPFLVSELLKSLAEDGVAPTADAAALIDRIGPEAVTRSTIMRLARIGDIAARAARGVAVLGPRASLESIGSLLRIPKDELPGALDALASARILQAGGAPEYVHPLIWKTVYEEIPTYVRSDLHARAAELIAAAGGEPEEVASHLMWSDPREDPAHVAFLTTAATNAIAQGAPDSAVAYLRRALAAQRPDTAGELLLSLGRAEQAAGDPQCIPHLHAAIAGLADPGDRALASLALAQSLFYAADFIGSWTALTDALEAVGENQPELAVALLSMAAHAGYGDTRLHREVRAQLPRLRQLADELGPRAPDLQVFLALVNSTDGGSTDGTLERLQRGLEQGRLLETAGSDAAPVALAVNVFVFIDELDRADQLAERMLADARRRGQVMGFVAGSAHSGLVALRRGALARAEAETRAALELAQQHGLAFAIPFSLTYLSEALLERGEIDSAIAMIDALPPMPGAELTLAGAMLRRVRGRLALAAGDRVAAAEHLRAAGEVLEALSMVNPNCPNWRSDLALAIHPTDPMEARELAGEELRLARAAGSPRAIGVALRACGLLGDTASLQDSVASLEHSPARLEHARSLVDLGAALRRQNQRADAREPLRTGLDLATRCGAAPLAERARQELLACGARPRRAMLTGRDALTPSELRIAELAARGRSNRDIAEALFIAPKTVENHLGRIYKKLSVGSREELPRVLTDA